MDRIFALAVIGFAIGCIGAKGPAYGQTEAGFTRYAETNTPAGIWVGKQAFNNGKPVSLIVIISEVVEADGSKAYTGSYIIEQEPYYPYPLTDIAVSEDNEVSFTMLKGTPIEMSVTGSVSIGEFTGTFVVAASSARRVSQQLEGSFALRRARNAMQIQP